MPIGYFRAKAEAERVIAGSGLPWTVLRAAQLHDYRPSGRRSHGEAAGAAGARRPPLRARRRRRGRGRPRRISRSAALRAGSRTSPGRRCSTSRCEPRRSTAVAPYSSSVTWSPHVASSSSHMARWHMNESADAPCQCHSPGGREHGVARSHHAQLAAAGLHEADAVGDVQRLPQGVAVPRRSGAGREAHEVDAQARRRLAAGDDVEVHVAREELGGSLGGRQRGLELHGDPCLPGGASAGGSKSGVGRARRASGCRVRHARSWMPEHRGGSPPSSRGA